MLVPNPRLIRLAGLTRGAQVEDDSELQIPPVLYPSIELASPVNRVFGETQSLPTGDYDDSFIKSERLTASGAVANATVTIAQLAKGMWVLEWTYEMSFAGTSLLNVCELRLQDVDGNQAKFAESPILNGVNIAMSGVLSVCFQRDGTTIVLSRGTTGAAGDLLHVHAFIVGRRIL